MSGPDADAGLARGSATASGPDTVPARLRRWRRHFSGPGDVIAFLGIGAALLRAPRLLQNRGLPQTLARLDARPRPELGNHGDEAAVIIRVQRLAGYADLWLRRLHLGNRCLRRSLVLFGRLRRAGLPVRFCLGIRTDEASFDDDPLEGHAWLELDGQPFLEPSPLPAQHVTTFRYPANTRRAASGR